jgi:hypothetical protein
MSAGRPSLRQVGALLFLLGLSSIVSQSFGQDQATKKPVATEAAQRFSDDDVAKLVAKIDQRIADRWRQADVQPAAAADDGEFLRRVYLDVIGRIPHVAEAREFFADKSPYKRQDLVRRLLASPGYVAHWTNVWRGAYLPEVESDFQFRFFAPSFEAWLRKQLLEDRTYSEWANELLTATPNSRQQQFIFAYGQTAEPTPLAFYLTKENKPENIAAAVARVFLGVRIECAQCHDHPLARWKREDFWSLAAFFQGTDRQPRGGFEGFLQDLFTFPEITIPDIKKVVQARFIDGSTPRFKGKVSFRQTLADWVTSPTNAYFAKATVNRLWAQFFGRGLVDPVDDFDEANVPSHPELLEELAEAFAQHEYDLKLVIRAITASRAYQLTSRQSHASQVEPRLLARAAVRGLTGEQLYDSVATATGYRDSSVQANPFAFNATSPRSEFLERFKAGAENPSDRQTSIVQALTLMNGQLTSDATSLNRSETLSAVLDFPLFSTAERVEALYLAALTRKPSAKELERFVKYVDSGGPKKDAKAALTDVFWALLNSSEFVLNH